MATIPAYYWAITDVLIGPMQLFVLPETLTSSHHHISWSLGIPSWLTHPHHKGGTTLLKHFRILTALLSWNSRYCTLLLSFTSTSIMYAFLPFDLSNPYSMPSVPMKIQNKMILAFSPVVSIRLRMLQCLLLQSLWRWQVPLILCYMLTFVPSFSHTSTCSMTGSMHPKPTYAPLFIPSKLPAGPPNVQTTIMLPQWQCPYCQSKDWTWGLCPRPNQESLLSKSSSLVWILYDDSNDILFHKIQLNLEDESSNNGYVVKWFFNIDQGEGNISPSDHMDCMGSIPKFTILWLYSQVLSE